MIEVLLKAKWWDWSTEKITKSIPVLVGDDMEALKELMRKEVGN